MSGRVRLVSGSTISYIGGWLALTAIMIELQTRGGPSYVTLYFFISTLAPALLGRTILSRIHLSPGRIWGIAQFIQSLSSLFMIFFVDNLNILLIFLAFSAIFQNIGASTFMALLPMKVSPEQRKSTVAAVSSGSSLAIVVGPAAGGFAVSYLGFGYVLLIQALFFLISLLLVPWRGTQYSASLKIDKSAFSSFAPPKGLWSTQSAKIIAFLWIVFATYGVLVDSLEMPFFTNVLELSASEIGLYISLYGAGGVLVFLSATIFNKTLTSLLVSLVLVAGTVLWLLGSQIGLSLFGFALCGLGYAMFNSSIRNQMDRVVSAAEETSSADCWAWFFQLSLICSAFGFAATSVFFAFGGGLNILIAGTFLVCIVMIIFSIRVQKLANSTVQHIKN